LLPCVSLVEKSNIMLLFLEVVLLLFDVTKLFYIEVWQRTSLITHGKLFDACPGIEGQFDLEAAPEVAARLRRCS